MTSIVIDESKRIDYMCILDFEATCQKNKTPKPQEIIEFPTLLVDIVTGNVIDTFHYYIKPDVHPELSEFCTKLTGIEQVTVDKGISLQEALVLHNDWLHGHNIVPAFLDDPNTGNIEQNNATEKSKTFVYVTCGDWDLKTCLPNQLAYHKKSVPIHFSKWINLKPVFKEFFCFKNNRFGMTDMLEKLNMELVGRHHSGIDDCTNLARICQKMIENGWKPTIKMLRPPFNNIDNSKK